MRQPLTVLQSQSYSKFNCIQNECEDNCCGGWGIVIDKKTFDNYRSCSHTELRPIMDTHVNVGEGGNDMAYAQIKLDQSNNMSPFLSEGLQCRIHSELGEQMLSRACSTYPRAVNLVDGVLECSLYMSCPEAVRSVLLDPDSMAVAASIRSQTLSFASPPSLGTHDKRYTANPYQHFLAVRELLTGIIRNRDYPLWERLLIVGFFCDHLERLINAGSGSTVPEIVSGYAGQLDQGLIRGAIDNVPY